MTHKPLGHADHALYQDKRGGSSAYEAGKTRHDTVAEHLDVPGASVTPKRSFWVKVTPRRWALWKNPTRVIVFVVCWESLLATVLAWGVATARPADKADWTRFAILAGCAATYMLLTRRQEERRRNRLQAVYIDFTGIWVFPAALLLPLHATLLLLALVGALRWANFRRPPHRFVFSLFTTALAAMVAGALFGRFEPLGQTPPAIGFWILAGIGLVYGGIQALVTGIVRLLGDPSHTPVRTALGSVTDNMYDAATIALGTVAAVLLLHLPPAMLILVFLSVLGNGFAEISQLQEEARTDVKTGLLNMRGWTETAERSFMRTAKGGRGPALLMIDLDHFKWINDNYGHPAGDDVIAQVGRLIVKAIRPTDVVGRFGGEEFVVLLTDADQAAAGQAAERIRTAIARSTITTTGRRGAPVAIAERTTSIGVAVHPQHGGTLEAILRAADAAVYEAKDRGRNQVRFARLVAAAPQATSNNANPTRPSASR